MKYLLMHKRTAVLELDIDKLGMIAKIGAVSAPEHLPVGVRTSKSGVDRGLLLISFLSVDTPYECILIKRVYEI